MVSASGKFTVVYDLKLNQNYYSRCIKSAKACRCKRQPPGTRKRAIIRSGWEICDEITSFCLSSYVQKRSKEDGKFRRAGVKKKTNTGDRLS